MGKWRRISLLIAGLHHSQWLYQKSETLQLSAVCCTVGGIDVVLKE
jgi:hypothetical protein